MLVRAKGRYRIIGFFFLLPLWYLSYISRGAVSVDTLTELPELVVWELGFELRPKYVSRAYKNKGTIP